MEIRNLNHRTLIWAIALCLAACARDPQATTPNTPLVAAKRNFLAIASTDFRQTGQLTLLSLTQSGGAARHWPIFSDAVVRAPVGMGKIYVVNRLLADNVQVIDKASSQVLQQFSVGQGSNPQDIAVVNENLAYVSRFGGKTMLKVNPATGQTLKEIGGFDADADGYPEMAWVLLQNHRLLVLLQRLNKQTFQPTDHSSLAVVDLDQDAVSQNYQLLRRNPVAEMRAVNGKLYIGEADAVGSLAGGIERRDATTLQSEGIIVEAAELGGDIVDFEIISPTLGAAIVGSDKTTLVTFDPTTGKKTGTLLDPGTYSLQRLRWDSDRALLLVGDGDVHSPAIRVFSGTPLVEQTAARMALPFAPYHFDLTD
jgi:hypothetical protein